MKIRIVTICDPLPNFGNRLQNYAVQKVLSDLFSADVKTLFFEKEKYLVDNKAVLKKLFHSVTRYRFTGDKRYWKSIFMKAYNFKKFNDKHIFRENITQVPVSADADYYVVGSDQVWNPQWYNTEPMKKYMFLLTFARKSQKVCFSPSFGVTDLQPEWKEYFEKYLSQFGAISVREEAGRDLVFRLAGKDAEVLIDPTLMLTAGEWRNLSHKPQNGLDTKNPYILTYFLGDIPEAAKIDIDRIQESGRRNIYHLMDMTQDKVYSSGPSEFLYLIDHADIILTDSFHACVFSFLFNKPFQVYSREGCEASMLSRMETLFNKFKLQKKYAEIGLNRSITEMFEHDYSDGYVQLEMERKKVTGFLKKQIR